MREDIPRHGYAADLPEAPGARTSRKDYGHTDSGVPITDAVIEELANEAERGFDVEEVLGRRGRRGRPPLRSAAATSSRCGSIQNSASASLVVPRRRASPCPR